MQTEFDRLFFSTAALAAMVGGTVVHPSDTQHKGLYTDSRAVIPGSVFLALRGARTDGHNYIDGAINNGATCIIAERIAEETSRTLPPACAVILVPNTLYALGALGKWFKRRTEPHVVAVTGSVGKTTTKQMIHAVLSHAFPAMRTEGNYNNEIGLPLTLMCIKPEDKIAVLEAGMNNAGELYRLSHICEPEVTVITNIGTSHIENLGSREGIRDAKLEMLSGMHRGGLVILNGDEPLLTSQKEAIRQMGLTPVTFAREAEDADYLAKDIRMTSEDCTFTVLCTETGEEIPDLRIPVTGVHNIGNAMAAYLCGRHFGMASSDIRAGLLAFENTGMRQNIRHMGEITLVEDCYNASPESMEAAIRVLTSLARDKGGRAVAVLGDMLELGAYADSLHMRVGDFAEREGVDLLFTFGQAASHIASGAMIAGMAEEHMQSYPDVNAPEACAEGLRACLRPGDTVLFKASRGTAIERVMNALFSASDA